MKRKWDFPIRKDKINRQRRAKLITKLYTVKSPRGSMEFVHLHRAIDFMTKFDPEAKLSVITLYGYERIKERVLV